RADRGTRAEAYESLCMSLSPKSAEAYGALVDLLIQDEPDDEQGAFNTTQDGAVIWNSREKRILYHILDKKGNNGIPEISQAIGSKSELEIQEYLKLLHSGLRHQHFNQSHARAIILSEIPAAAEISKACSSALDEYAEFLCLKEQLAEDVIGKQKHKNLWIIDRETAEHVEEPFKHLDGQVGIVSSAERTSGLLNLPKWILLSERLFMNFGSSRLEDNWANVAFEDESPSMTAEACGEFHDIALKITRDLVQSAIEFARMRCRGKRTGRRPAKVVRSSDVRKAARLLNMKRNSSDFWIGLARRCCLDVADIRHKKGWKTIRLNYDEVEGVLSGKTQLPNEPYERPSSEIISRRISEASIASESSFDPQDDEDDLEVAHAEALDQKISHAQELHCWTLIGKPPPASFSAQVQDIKLPPRPKGKRKTMEELVDWRDRTPYHSEWEEYGYETRELHKKLRRNHRKRRRIE
ncbi:hypothetical protein P175DRAFT_0425119, partial [Aspergillus ochraceoroseus IBT 24754]